MEENSLVKKIRRQGELIHQQVEAFRRSFQHKNINHLHFAPYLQSLEKVFSLNHSYGADYLQFVPKEQLSQILNNNKTFLNDLVSKFKFLVGLISQSQVKPQRVQQTNICDVCKQDKMVKNIQKAKGKVNQDINLSKLRNMIKDMQRQSSQLFSREEDTIFYKHLHRALQVKEEMLSLRDNHIEQYLQQTIRYLGQIKSMQQVKYDQVQETPQKIDWSAKIKEQINQEFLKAFKGKIPPWLQKMFDKFLQLYKKINFKAKQSKGIQTGQYICDQIIQLRSKIQATKIQQKQQRCIRQQYLKQKQNLQITVSLLKTQIDTVNQQKMKNIILLHQSKKRGVRNSITNSNPLEGENMTIKNQNKNKAQLLYKAPNDGKSGNGRVSMLSSQYQKQNFRQLNSLTEHTSSNYQTLNSNKRVKNRKITDITSLKHRFDQISGFLPDISNAKLRNKQQLSVLRNEQRSSANQLKQLALKSDHFASTTMSKLNKENNFDIQQIQQKQQLEDIQNNMETKLERINGYKKRVSMVNQQLIKRNSIQKRRQSSAKTQNILANGQKNKFSNQNISPRSKERFQSSHLKSQALNNLHEHTYKDSYTQMSNSQRENLKAENQRQSLMNLRRNEQIQVQIKQKINKGKNNFSFKSIIDNSAQRGKHDISDKNAQKFNVHVQSKESLKKNVMQVQKCIQTQNSQLYDFMKQGSKLIQKISVEHLERIAKKLLGKGNKTRQNQKKQQIQLHNSSFYRNQAKIKQPSEALKKLKGILTQNQQNNCAQRKQVKKLINKSLSPTNFQSLNESLISPQSLKQQKQAKQVKILTKKDFFLFLNQEAAYQYQASLKKKYHNNVGSQISQQEKDVYKSAFSMIQLIKKHSPQVYKKIIAFIRYPYQTIANDFSIIDIVKQMNFQAFLHYMTKIRNLHRKCQKYGSHYHCQHIEYFIQRISNILVDLTYQNDFQQEDKTQITIMQDKVLQQPKVQARFKPTLDNGKQKCST